MTNTLIDMDVLAERVQNHLGKLNLHHVSYVEVIKMLCDELDAREERVKLLYGAVRQE